MKFLTDSEITDETALGGNLGGGGGKFHVKRKELAKSLQRDSGIEATLVAGTTTSVAIPAKTLVEKIVVTATGTGNITAGTAAAGTDVLASTAYINGSKVIALTDTYYAAAGSLHFAVFTGTITVRIYTR